MRELAVDQAVRRGVQQGHRRSRGFAQQRAAWVGQHRGKNGCARLEMEGDVKQWPPRRRLSRHGRRKNESCSALPRSWSREPDLLTTGRTLSLGRRSKSQFSYRRVAVVATTGVRIAGRCSRPEAMAALSGPSRRGPRSTPGDRLYRASDLRAEAKMVKGGRRRSSAQECPPKVARARRTARGARSKPRLQGPSPWRQKSRELGGSHFLDKK